MSELAGRHVVITGATGALGGAVARLLAGRGAICHLPIRRADAAPEGVAEARVAEGIDLADEAAVGRFYRTLTELWGSVHCAGGFAMQPLAECSAGDLERMWRMNALTSFLCCREAVRVIRRTGSGEGRLVNVTARAGVEPRAGGGMAAYTASKAAVAALTVALAEELALERIWVNAVAPAILDTPQNRAAMPRADHSSWADVDGVAEVIAFLVSPQNRTVRGALIPVPAGG